MLSRKVVVQRHPRIRRGIVGLVIALSAFAYSVAPAGAWTWNLNSFPTDDSCGQTSSQPCLLWQLPHYTVESTNAYLDGSIVMNVNFQTILTNTVFPNIRTLPDYSMNYTACEYSCSAVLRYYGGSLGCGVYGATYYDTYSTPEYTSSNGIGWYAFIRAENVYFNNSGIIWNTSFNWSTVNSCEFYADARKVAAHETGHTEGLGHTAHTPAVMHQGPENYYAYQTDDVNGFNGIYPGNQPSS